MVMELQYRFDTVPWIDVTCRRLKQYSAQKKLHTFHTKNIELRTEMEFSGLGSTSSSDQLRRKWSDSYAAGVY